MEDPEGARLFTSYSLRRFQPTLCDIRQASHEERLAIGGWRESPGLEGTAGVKRNLMPTRYNAQRDTTE
eukprot:6481341-Amphidinium_carterae.1